MRRFRLDWGEAPHQEVSPGPARARVWGWEWPELSVPEWVMVREPEQWPWQHLVLGADFPDGAGRPQTPWTTAPLFRARPGSLGHRQLFPWRCPPSRLQHGGRCDARSLVGTITRPQAAAIFLAARTCGSCGVGQKPRGMFAHNGFIGAPAAVGALARPNPIFLSDFNASRLTAFLSKRGRQKAKPKAALGPSRAIIVSVVWRRGRNSHRRARWPSQFQPFLRTDFNGTPR